MNTAIRAVVRKGIYHGLEVSGIRCGYAGLLDDDVVEMGLSSVGGITNRGGTILMTARCEEMKTPAGLAKAAEVLRRRELDGLVVIGGDGSFRAAWELAARGVATIGVPATIDNDIAGTDFTIGFDTAVNTALDAIDRIRDTASAHRRLFVVEVMGRASGFLALQCALAGGAEAALLPETETDLDALCEKIVAGHRRGKTSSIVIVAEGDEVGGAFRVAEQIKGRTGFDVRVSVLGHLQRGGSPTALDRVLASRLGAASVEELIKGSSGKMVGLVANEVRVSELRCAWEEHKGVDLALDKLLQELSI